ncbi:hypothetical protein F7725_021450 [Dissostichus mawsoni]|uniref:SGNH hydrolase-type esterase domain-containing protein n=1 Tax=Dissostichus mawsoni TaxID=36200 RepID=A0A7J5ZD41_DISMA|nr:hypothetical protein F7725_021450 [Dissostichus mawsoni]
MGIKISIHKLPQMAIPIPRAPITPTTSTTPLIPTPLNQEITKDQTKHTKPNDPKPGYSRPSKDRYRFIHHDHLGDKKKNWSLTPYREVIIMGSSNISRLPRIHDARIQVDSYPGANLSHAINIIKYKTPTAPEVTKVLLCFGLNDRGIGDRTILNNNLNQLLSSARDTFPNAAIHVPKINHSTKLSLKAIKNIGLLNKLIEKTPGNFKPLGAEDFDTEGDLIHWTPLTAKKMWDHWRSSLDLGHPN